MRTVAHLHPEDFGAIMNDAKESGTYSVRFTFPKAGMYLIGIDAMDASGEFSEQFIVAVSGNDTLARAGTAEGDPACFSGYPQDGRDRYTEAVTMAGNESCEDTYRVRFSHVPDTLRSGEPATLSFPRREKWAASHGLGAVSRCGASPCRRAGRYERPHPFHGEPTGTEDNDHRSGLVPVAFAHEGEMEIDEMGGMMHHHETLPAAFGPDLVSKPIVFTEEGRYYVFGQFKRDGNIVFTRFAVDVKKETYSSAHFEHLRKQTTNSCDGGKAVVFDLPEDGRLQGSCCGPMNMHSYHEQIAGLKAKYSGYDIIPLDPYDVPVAWARQMIEYSDKTALTPDGPISLNGPSAVLNNPFYAGIVRWMHSLWLRCGIIKS